MNIFSKQLLMWFLFFKLAISFGLLNILEESFGFYNIFFSDSEILCQKYNIFHRFNHVVLLER